MCGFDVGCMVLWCGFSAGFSYCAICRSVPLEDGMCGRFEWCLVMVGVVFVSAGFVGGCMCCLGSRLME